MNRKLVTNKTVNVCKVFVGAQKTNFKLAMAVPAIFLLLTACISTSSQEVSERAEIFERYNVDFSDNVRWINLKVTAPPHTDVNNIEAFYSVVDEQCPDEVRQGQVRHFLEFELLKDSEAGRVYTRKVPLDGGGACKWRLSKLDFGLAYTSVEHLDLGDDYQIGPGAGVTVYLHNNEFLLYEKDESINYSPEFYVEYRNIENIDSYQTNQVDRNYSGKWINFMAPFNQSNRINLYTDLVSNDYNIDFSPKLVENKRAFFQVLGKRRENRDISTVYYIDNEEVKKTNDNPEYKFLNNPEFYIFWL